jgi:RNase P/RNase MRP subunit p29
MKRFLIAAMCAGVFLVLNSINTDAATTKTKTKTSKTSKKESITKEAENMQCREITIIGTMSEAKEEEIKDKDGKVIQKLKYCVVTDSKKKDWRMPRDANVAKFKEFEGLKVKIVGMVLGNGSTLLSIKQMDKM